LRVSLIRYPVRIIKSRRSLRPFGAISIQARRNLDNRPSWARFAKIFYLE
jgi:hypothetical protein